MSRQAKEGTPLSELIQLAIEPCQQAESECPRSGPGRPLEIRDWVMAMLIMIGVLKQRKSKSAQWSYLTQNRVEIQKHLPGVLFPSRSTFYERYRRSHKLFQKALKVQGRMVIAEGVVDARVVAVDKTLLTACGPAWHRKDRLRGHVPAGVDRDSQWGYGEHHGWVQGYSAEIVVSAGKAGVVCPLLASVDTANVKEQRSFPEKIALLPPQTKYVLADSGYDSNKLAEEVEGTDKGKRTGRRWLCRAQSLKGRRPARQKWHETEKRRRHRELRDQRKRFFKTPKAKRIYVRRGKTIEPFFSWFKTCFDLHDRVHHRGLDNNQTQILAATFCYQVLLRYNHQRGKHNGEIQWILNAL